MPKLRAPKTRTKKMAESAPSLPASSANDSIDSTTSSASASASTSASARPRTSAGGPSKRGPGARRGRPKTAPAPKSAAGGTARANIQVAVRCRPFSAKELNTSDTPILKFPSESSLLLRQSKSKGTKQYTFDHVFGPETAQTDVYDAIVAPIVEEAMTGFNCTIFAYGQTGTGKTYTMEGLRDPETSSFVGSEHAGIIPRTIESIFAELEASGAEYSVRVSYLEIYNEELHDLLGLSEPPLPLRIFEDNKGSSSRSAGGSMMTVHNLEEVPVTSASDIFPILERGQAKRQVAATKMNATSSRSHAIFSITIHIKESNAEGEDLLKVGKLNLVDLAGSENIGRSGAQSKRAREAGLINQSLLTLGRVINALIERRPHIPYRESKLTRILQDSLGGTTKTCVIATVSPSEINFEETLSTLDYASRAKTIINTPVANQRMTKRVVLTQYIREIEMLKNQLQAAREASGVYLPLEQFTGLNEKIEELESELETATAAVEEGEVKLTELGASLADATARVSSLEAELESTLASLASEVEWTSTLTEHGNRAVAKGNAVRETALETLTQLGGTHTKIDAYATNAGLNSQSLSSYHQAVDEKENAFADSVSDLKASARDSFAALKSQLTSLSQASDETAAALTASFAATSETLTQTSEDASAAVAQAQSHVLESVSAIGTSGSETLEEVSSAMAQLAEQVEASQATVAAAFEAQVEAQKAVVAFHADFVASLQASLTGFEAELETGLDQIRTQVTQSFSGVASATSATDSAVVDLKASMAAAIAAEKEALMAKVAAMFDAQAESLVDVLDQQVEIVQECQTSVDQAMTDGQVGVESSVETMAGVVRDSMVRPEYGSDQVEAEMEATTAALAEAQESGTRAVVQASENVTSSLASVASTLETSVATAVETTESALGTSVAQAVETIVSEVGANIETGTETVQERQESSVECWASANDQVEVVDHAWTVLVEEMDEYGADLVASARALDWVDVGVTGATPVKADMTSLVVAGEMTPVPVRLLVQDQDDDVEEVGQVKDEEEVEDEVEEEEEKDEVEEVVEEGTGKVREVRTPLAARAVNVVE